MIRYVVAIILVVALLGVGFAGLERAAVANSEQTVTAGVSAFEDAAVSLVTEDELAPRGHPGPRRFVTIEVPDRSLTSQPVTDFELRRVGDERLTVAEYRVEGADLETETIDVPIRNATGGDVVELDGSGRHELRLTLVRDHDDRPAVEVVRTSELDAT